MSYEESVQYVAAGMRADGTVALPDGTVFDPQFYAAANPDVLAALGTDAGLLYMHYMNCGMAEGRFPNANAAQAALGVMGQAQIPDAGQAPAKTPAPDVLQPAAGAPDRNAFDPATCFTYDYCGIRLLLPACWAEGMMEPTDSGTVFSFEINADAFGMLFLYNKPTGFIPPGMESYALDQVVAGIMKNDILLNPVAEINKSVSVLGYPARQMRIRTAISTGDAAYDVTLDGYVLLKDGRAVLISIGNVNHSPFDYSYDLARIVGSAVRAD